MDPNILWHPDEHRIQNSQMDAFRRFVNQRYDVNFHTYDALYKWSVTELEAFWGSVWDFTEIISTVPYTSVVCNADSMPGAEWFPGAHLNFAQNLLRFKDDSPAVISWTESGGPSVLTFAELHVQTARVAAAMLNAGIQPGDRVAAFMPNIPETVTAMLAAASIGAVWSSTSPDFGIQGVVDRFRQIQPKWLFTASGYMFKGKWIDINPKLEHIIDELPSLTRVIQLKGKRSASLNSNLITGWDEIQGAPDCDLEFESLPFSHPLYIMFSSGTTGLPKSIVHSAGGTLIQHLKELVLHTDLKRGDRIFYYTTCGWMMWNWLVSSLSVGAAVVLYDGNPFFPDSRRLLRMIDESGINIFGTSARYIAALQESGVKPKSDSDFPSLQTILSTGSPLSPASFDYVYREWKENVQLSSIAGGTDIISCFNLGNPVLPVVRGEIQCRGLGMKVESYDAFGEPAVGEKGELVCTLPFPSMPVGFWNDEDGEKYHNAYFKTFKNIWHHGDFIIISRHGGVTMCGRSDATLNPGGVRMGTAEFYAVLEKLEGIADSVVVGQNEQGDEKIILFVKLDQNLMLDEMLEIRIRQTLRKECSPRHVPWKIFQVREIPYTINGKKIEIAVKQTINNEPVLNLDALINPDALKEYAYLMRGK